MNERPLQIDELLQHGDFLRALARRLLRDEHLAEDVVQETFAAAIARPPAHTGNLRGWLATVARNLSFRRQRTEARHTARVRASAAPGEEADAAETAERLETGRRLVAAVTVLPEPYRTTVMRRWFDGLGPSEIARRSGIPVKTVETRIRRAVAMLRERLLEEHAGNRRKLALGLGLLAGPGIPGIVPTTTTALAAGGMIMGNKLAVAAALLFAVGISWFWTHAEAPTPPDREPGGAPTIVGDTVTEEPGRSEAAEEEPAPAPDAVRIAGIVTEKETGKPVPGANVRAFEYERGVVLETATDGEGRFEVPGSSGATGTYHLVVTSAGRSRVDVPAARPAPEPLDIRIPRGGVLSGRVTTNGLPVTAYRIAAVPLPFPEEGAVDPHASLSGQALPREFVVASEKEIENPEGRFRFEHLAPGKYALVVHAPGHQPHLANGGSRLDRHPGFDVESGEEVEVDVVLPPTGHVKIRVHDAASGRPILTGVTFRTETDISMHATDALVSEVEPDFADADGTYHLPVALSSRGTLHSADLTVACEGYAPVEFSFGNHANGHLFEVSLIRPANLRGTVRGLDGRPQEGVILLVERSSGGHVLARANTDAAGSFFIEGLPSQQELVVRGQDGGLRAAVFSVPVTLRPEETRELDIGGPETAAIYGIVTIEGRPCDGAHIRLMAEDLRYRVYVLTGVDGRFRMEHLRPDRYRLFASIVGRDGDAVQLTRQVDLAERERKEVIFAVDLRIEGVVVNGETGEPVPEGVEIAARLVGGEETVATRVLTGGRIVLRPNRPGIWELGCENDNDWVTARRPRADLTREAQATGLRLELFPDPGDGGIVIHVVDAKTREPIAAGNLSYRHKINQGFRSITGGRIALPDARFDKRLGLGRYHFMVAAGGYVPAEVTVVLTLTEKVRELTVELHPSEAVRILAVADGAMGQEVGLRAGDLLVRYGSTRVRTVRELIRVADATDPSEPVTLEVVRNGRKMSVKARGGPIGARIVNSGLE